MSQCELEECLQAGNDAVIPSILPHISLLACWFFLLASELKAGGVSSAFGSNFQLGG